MIREFSFVFRILLLHEKGKIIGFNKLAQSAQQFLWFCHANGQYSIPPGIDVFRPNKIRTYCHGAKRTFQFSLIVESFPGNQDSGAEIMSRIANPFLMNVKYFWGFLQRYGTVFCSEPWRNIFKLGHVTYFIKLVSHAFHISIGCSFWENHLKCLPRLVKKGFDAFLGSKVLKIGR